MVMRKRNAMSRNLLRSIKNSLGRYIAIVLIIALGAGIFVGLRMTKADMVATGQKYLDEQNMFDLQMVCSYGWGEEELEAVKQFDGLTDVEGVFYTDLIVNINQSEDDQVYRFYTIPEKINRLVLLGGRMPEKPDECLIDGFQHGDEILGKQVVIRENNEEDALEDVNYRILTVVGYVRSPLYMDMTRGATSVGNGSIKDCLYVPKETFDVDYYTEIHVTIPGDYKIYSDRYNDAMDAKAEELEHAMETLAAQRLVTVLADAEQEYQDGWVEYMDGVQEYTEGMHESYDELKEAYYDLLEGEQEIADNEEKLKDAEVSIEIANMDIYNGRKELDQAEMDLEITLNTALDQIYKTRGQLQAQKPEAEAAVAAADAALAEINAAWEPAVATINEYERNLATYSANIAAAEAALAALGPDASEEEKNAAQSAVDAAQSAYNGYVAANQPAYAQACATKSLLDGPRNEALAGKATADGYYSQIVGGLSQLDAQEQQLYAQISAGSEKIAQGRKQLDEGEQELYRQVQKLEEAREELENAKVDLADGWVEYEDGLEEAREELADGRKDLDEARQELADARETIDGMTENTLHILDRNTNVGYASLDSSSDIVEGVSRVFPAFFLLVAALVCITTMTRMVDEERTQIGTLKALGYSNRDVISKYMLYAGTSAVLGCGLGVIFGSVVFPMILWEAYKIMLFVDDTVVLTFNLWLCFVVVAAYTMVELLVTWYCCRRSLEEVPAELIRPKAPAIGKQLIFEKLKIWRKLSFLNKVTVRNIFRYRQRLAMMLVGIGGCTALLLTGFGLRDSIVNIVDFQFEDVTTYDMEVYFEKGQTPEQMDSFREDIKSYAEEMIFYHQTSVEIDFENQVREIYMIAAEDDIRNFIDFHHKEEPLDYPGENEMLLSSGVADALGIKAGDVVIIRDADMRTMELTVSGVYYNYVYNYMIVNPETVEMNWGETPEIQMALVRALDGQDVHQVSAEVVSMDNVMNVSVSEDLALMVHNMMDALDLVVWVIVFCAALLAATVLYNLTNININERIREIATIKVLGFNATETGMYIFKENLILSIMGAGMGLLFGKFLLDFVMDQIKINMVWFLSRALPMSYVLSVIITIFMALVVDFVFYFKLQKINMAEALKSVE